MISTAVLVVEGVIRSHVGDGMLSPGANIYHGLAATMGVVLVSNSSDQDLLNHWLRLNGFNKHPLLVVPRATDGDQIEHIRAKQISRVREAGHVVEFVVEPDPSVSASLLRSGIAVMNYIHPRYSKPEHRPDYDGKIKPWSVLESEVLKQEELRTSDSRPSMGVS